MKVRWEEGELRWLSLEEEGKLRWLSWRLNAVAITVPKFFASATESFEI